MQSTSEIFCHRKLFELSTYIVNNYIKSKWFNSYHNHGEKKTKTNKNPPHAKKTNQANKANQTTKQKKKSKEHQVLF